MASSQNTVAVVYGIVKKYNAERGFGFARMDDGPDAFIHIQQARSTPSETSFGMERMVGEPKVGDRIQAICADSPKGRRASVWGRSTRQKVVKQAPPPAVKADDEFIARTIRDIHRNTAMKAPDSFYRPPNRTQHADVIDFHRGDMMKQRVRIQLEDVTAPDARRPYSECTCLITPEAIDQMEERPDNCDRIPRADVESTFFVYRVVRHECPQHYHMEPIRFMVFRDCGAWPLDSERVTYVGVTWRRQHYYSLVENGWYDVLRDHGYSDPRDYDLD